MYYLENYLGTLILLSFCSLISAWEKHQDGTMITPFGVIAWPYAIIVSMINLGGIYFGFFSVSLKSIVFVMLCLLFFLVGGRGIGMIFQYRKENKNVFFNPIEKLTELLDFYRPFFISIAIISIVIGYINLYLSLDQNGWFFLASKEFEESYGKGLLAHITLLNRPAIIFLFADYLIHKKKSILLLLILMFVTILILQIKNNIMTIILSCIYFGYFYSIMKLNIKKIIIYALIIYGIFNISYVIGFSRIGIVNAYSFKVQHYLLNQFFTYLFGGPIGFSEILTDPTYPLYQFDAIFAVPFNLYNTIIGNPDLVNVIFYHWIPVSNIYQYFHLSNVFGIFGMLYMYIGPYATWIYMFLLGTSIYYIRFLAFKKNAFIGFQLIYVFMISYLTISFFGLYFNILIVHEASFFMFMMPFLYLLFRRLIRMIHM
ncbi:oligosaccharide repeat unit polymerase [bacterium]|nr:oligosaccharide repeat unit polymerase [bacterium]RQV93732.1 MAG: hypothetical protein EH221_08640 [bacterium]